MKEQLVSFKTAKLARKKGFNERVWDYYSNSNEEFIEGILDNGMIRYNFDPDYIGTISAPTQSLLQRWLREKHDINITILIVGNDYHQYILHDKERKYVETVDNPITYENQNNNWEDTFEKGLFEALKLVEI